MRRQRSICLCIDDFGLDEGINEAALTLTRDGRVHALSCMVGGPAWSSGSRVLLRESTGPLDIGLHLDLTEHPLTLPARRWQDVWLSGQRDRLSMAALRQEIRAQLDAFERDMAMPPDFVDGHQHVHQFPQVRDALLDELIRRYPFQQPWLRSTRAAGWAPKGLILSALGRRPLIDGAQLHGFAHNRRLLGVYDFQGGPSRYAALMTRWLRQARHGDLLMCHPSARRVPGDAIAQARLDEYQVLSGSQFEWQVHSHGVRLDAMTRLLHDARFPAVARVASSS